MFFDIHLLFRGIKQICVVGNSANLIGGGLGKTINQQEYVVRFNRGLPQLNPDLEGDIGNKTDIYVNRRILIQPPIPELVQQAGIKYVFSRIIPPVMATAERRSFRLAKLEVAAKEIFSCFPAIKLTSGLAFLELCLRHCIPEINICGFTTEENYNPNTLSEFCGDKKTTIGQREEMLAAEGTIPAHNLAMERYLISEMVRQGRVHYLK